jgi:hypothetical protein
MAYNISIKLKENLRAIGIAIEYQKGNPLSDIPKEAPVIQSMPGKEASMSNGHTILKEAVAVQQSEMQNVRSRMRL